MKNFKYLLITLLITLATSLSQAANSVGEVTLVIGEVNGTRADGTSLPMKRGELVYAGDVLETADGGHVHVRFVDGALVSVRPASRLVVEQYEESAGSRVAIKFKVEKGVVRSITGKWGQANPEKFRLNTPVAAIGVKGTDFVVKVDGAATQAAVFTGAITMSALTPECAQSLGPCDNANTLTLAADMNGVMLQLAPQENSSPTLAPAVDLLVRRIQTQQAVAGNRDAPDTRIAESTVRTAMAADKLIEPKPMVWLHNQFDWNVPSHTISQRYTNALAAGMQPVVGSLFISLYRDEALLKLYQPNAINQVAFTLKNASAVYQPGVATGRPVEIARISDASFKVDFAKSTYVTHLDISSPYAGGTVVNMAGRIDASGRFVDNNVNTSVAGALSQNGKEAGYMFNQAIGLGNLSGLTLWGQ